MKNRTIYRYIFAGGGTGGHLYPALAVAQQIKELKPEAEILFIGAKNKIEERVVPNYNFNLKTIWITGFSRKFSVNNLLFPLKLFVSFFQALVIVIKFKPRVVVGTGAYVSGPVVWAASIIGSKIILLEQNSYPGITNRLLEKKATEIHIAFEETKKYFRDKSKIVLSGNPIRINLNLVDKIQARRSFSLDDNKKTILIIGGSGGAKSLNHAVAKSLDKLLEKDIQVLWQTGKVYYQEFKKYSQHGVKVMEYFDDMSLAYSSCDIVIARAGATTIAEVSLLGLPVIFVPSSNVAADHQYKNAKTLQDENAALIIPDNEVEKKLYDTTISLIYDEEKLKELRNNIKKFSNPDAALNITKKIIHLSENL
ncbi:MAG: undecaprenyldiphospho-muramoylpentapeptide beta-N-acetylglucosaminyltransferase [Melioribacteraceae bacterium]|nr:undecaprenyldiphospho-muramoylpentapeptide beta-N-acetylglucosaminyltransferase [Melioribacteraceae bacterium]